MNPQQELEELLRKKGIGPEGSKSLKEEELQKLDTLLQHDSVSLVTKATILTAFLILEPTDSEKKWLENLKRNYPSLPQELHLFFETDRAHPYAPILYKILKKEALTEKESEKGMKLLFNNEIEDCYKAAFLEGERLKRESFEENRTFLNFLYKRIARKQTNLPLLIDICDNYDGSNRTRNFSLFTAALLGAAGFPTLVHGMDSVAPKFGYTPHLILKAAGKNPLISMDMAQQNLADPSISWAYLDQQIYFPELYQLKQVRKEMVKRPFLATFEKLLQPVRASNGNLMITGFTHTHYKTEIARQLKEQAQCKQAIVLKGTEGSSHMSLTKETICVFYNGEEIHETTVHPASYKLKELEARLDKSLTEAESLKEGLEALSGEKNYARENILYMAHVILDKFNLLPSDKAGSLLTETLNSGKALKAWEAGNR